MPPQAVRVEEMERTRSRGAGAKKATKKKDELLAHGQGEISIQDDVADEGAPSEAGDTGVDVETRVKVKRQKRDVKPTTVRKRKAAQGWNEYKSTDPEPKDDKEYEKDRMTKSRALEEFQLKEAHLKFFTHVTRENPHYRYGAPMCLYEISDLRLMRDYGKSSQVKFIALLTSFYQVHGDPKNAETVHAVKEAIRQKRNTLRQERIKGRRDTMQAALQEKGLTLRDDSVLCSQYIRKGLGDLGAIVNIMVEMDWYFRCTEYETLRIIHDSDYEDYGYRRRRDHVDSEYGKSRALEEWCKERVSKGIFTLPRFDPDGPDRPPRTLWGKIEAVLKRMEKAKGRVGTRVGRSLSDGKARAETSGGLDSMERDSILI
ncbi:hypothetical protein HDU67_005049 [Dinochytrium kinnereticum]|nr:hypothetical protein HDU67_005049 [Dinochytrium kinnereticum]